MDEKRSFLRIPTQLPCRLRTMDDAGRPLYQAAGTSADMDLGALKSSGLPEGVQAFLTHLNAKLDRILMELSGERMREHFPMQATAVEISAAGMRFTCDERLAEGQRLEVLLLLSQLPLKLAGAVGNVVRIEDNGGKPEYILDFTSISDVDQEAVVQFVFREQRASIREQKGY